MSSRSHNYKRIPVEDCCEGDVADDSTHLNTTNVRSQTCNDLVSEAKSDTDTDTDTAHSHELIYDASVFLLQIGQKKRKIGVNKDWRVFQIKQTYFKQQLLDGKNIRLIFRGLILDDYKLVFKDYQITDNGFIHVSIANQIGNQSRLQKEQSLRNTNSDLIVFDDGLDLSDRQIAERLQASELSNSLNGLNHNPRENESAIEIENGNENGNENDNLSAMNMNAVNNGSAMNSQTMRNDFACGFFMGLMIGIWVFFVLLFVRRTYSRQFRLGVLAGVMFNVMLEFFNQTNNHSSSGNSDQTNTDNNEGVNENQTQSVAADE